VKSADAQTCNAPCYAATADELSACGTPPNLSYLPGDIRRYGASPTASDTVNGAAINCAIRTGYSLYFPDGTFLTTGSHAPRSNTTWWGSGTLKSSGGTAPLVTSSNISGFTFAINTDCSLQTAGTIKTAMTFDGCSNFTVQDGRHVQGCLRIGPSAGCHDFRISRNVLIGTDVNSMSNQGAISVIAQSHDFEISDNDISGSTGAGIVVYNSAYHVIISGNHCVGSTTGSGMFISAAQYITIQGNVCRNNAQSGIGLNPSSASAFGYPSYCTITGNVCANNLFDGIDYALSGDGLQHATWTTISGNVLTGNGTNANGGTGINLMNADEVTICGNTVVANNIEGIRLQSCNYCTISGNTVVANGVRTANTYDGIYITGGTFNTVSGNTSTNNGSGATQRAGISEGPGSNFNTIVGNNVNNNISGTVTIAGSGTRVQGNMPLSFDKMASSYVFSSFTAPGTAGIPNGSIWMNTSSGTLNVLQSGTWVAK